MPAIKARTLILIAEEDEIIPREQSDALVKSFTGKPCEVVTIPGAGHNTLDQHYQYHKYLNKFFAVIPLPQTL